MGTPAEIPLAADVSTDEPPLVFVHIQKTAGLSLRKILLREYGGRRNVTHLPNVFSKGERSHELVAAIAAAPPPGIRVFHGHIMCWPDVDWPPSVRFFTILRDPVDRVISHASWLQERSGRKTDLTEAVKRGAVPDNLQTRVLAARSEPFGEVPEAALGQAIENIDRFSVVGLTHRFDESLVLLSRTFGWRRVTYERANVTRGRTRREDLSEETVELIRQFNALDEKLFAHARERFERDVAAQGPGFRIEVEALKAANALYAQAAEGSVLDAELPMITNGLPVGQVDTEQLLVDTQAELLAREEVRLVQSERRERLERQRETSTRRNARLRKKLDAKEKRNQRLISDAARLEAELRGLRRNAALEHSEPARTGETAPPRAGSKKGAAGQRPRGAGSKRVVAGKAARGTAPKKGAAGKAARGTAPKKGAAGKAARGTAPRKASASGSARAAAPRKASASGSARAAAPRKASASGSARAAAPRKASASGSARAAAPRKGAAGKAARGTAARKVAPKKVAREAPRDSAKRVRRRAS